MYAPGTYDIAADIAAYRPRCDQERADQALMLRRLREDPHVFDRSSIAHMTSSVWVVDPTLTETLLVYHRIYRSWSWIGGHADGQSDLARVALRELEEETGVSRARLLPLPAGGICSLEALCVNGHEKGGAYVSSHVHLNVSYLAVASPAEHLRQKPDENAGVRWVPIERVGEVSEEPWMVERVYDKLVTRLEEVRRQPGPPA